MDDTKPKPATVDKKEPIGAGVQEHPISEVDAKKFAGAGDFTLPTQENSLDSLVPDAKPPVAQPMPVPSPVATKDLEAKAKELIQGKTAEAAENNPPKKKKKGGAATKMALAAVLMVMMGAGGIAGMNLLKMNQVGDIRQQAYTQMRNGGAVECKDNADSDYETVLMVTLKSETPDSGELGDACTPRSDGASYTNVYTIENKSSSSRTVVFNKDSNYCPDQPCGEPELNYIVCHQNGSPPETETLELGPGESKDITVTRASDVGQSCGSYQVDIILESVSGVYRCRDFVASGVLLTGNTCPSGDYRPNMCEDVVPGDPDVSLLQPGQSLSVTAKSNQPASRFQLSFYNMQNQDSGGPKPFIIDGSHYAMLSPVIDPMVEEYTFTVNYADIHKPDENWGDQIPSSVVYYAYFFDADGNFSSNVAECHGTINFGSTPPPTTTPEPIACVSLQKTPASVETGQQVTLTCSGSGNGIHHYEFRYQVGSGAWVSVPAASITNNVARITPTVAGSYTAQCRVCGGASDCQNWEPVNPDDN